MEKAVVLVLVLGIVAWTAADPEGELMSNEIGEDLLTKGMDILESAQNEFKEEGRGPGAPLKKALLPFLIGLTLKAGSLVPVKLMIMTFVVVMALIFAKLGLAVSALVGYLHYQESHKAKLAGVTDKWFIPSPTHSSGGHESHSAASNQQPVLLPAPGPSPGPSPGSMPGSAPGSASGSGPESGPNTKRLQHFQQYDPYRYDPYNNDPYRFTRYDYPH
ncbi:hypothetical protein GE061_015646 [Apolygus lucorum]|uniref:Uncharacterized protein n=1 Tax=Apolygus lucorum TaxID=248454 RepID=A0A6A4JHL9_APOLU|nr:hypothetical protein GE061_015646 [Apolygus lucorum]